MNALKKQNPQIYLTDLEVGSAKWFRRAKNQGASGPEVPGESGFPC